MVIAKIENGQIQNVYDKTDRIGDTEIRKGEFCWLRTEALEKIERRCPLGSHQVSQPKQQQQRKPDRVSTWIIG